MLKYATRCMWSLVLFLLLNSYSCNLFGTGLSEDSIFLTSFVKLRILFVQQDFDELLRKRVGINECVASVLSDNVLLTAAHCLQAPSGWKLYSIEYEFSKGEYIVADSFYINRNYESAREGMSTERNLAHIVSDIAIVKFAETPFKYRFKMRIDTDYVMKSKKGQALSGELVLTRKGEQYLLESTSQMEN